MIKIQEMTSKQVDAARIDFSRKMADKYGDKYGSKMDDSELRESTELSCRGMMISILAYECDPSMNIYEVIDILMNDEYIKAYITGKGKWGKKEYPLGYDTVLELAKDMARDYCGKAKLSRNTFTDSEGLSYNSLTYDDE